MNKTTDGGWKGGEVKADPPGEAERNADLAEGNERITVAASQARDATSEPVDRPPTPAPGADDEENMREKREAAAEAHREREATGEPPFGKKL